MSCALRTALVAAFLAITSAAGRPKSAKEWGKLDLASLDTQLQAGDDPDMLRTDDHTYVAEMDRRALRYEAEPDNLWEVAPILR